MAKKELKLTELSSPVRRSVGCLGGGVEQIIVIVDSSTLDCGVCHPTSAVIILRLDQFLEFNDFYMRLTTTPKK